MSLEAYIALICSLVLNAVLLIRMGNKKVREQENNITEEEIRQMVDAGGDNGSIDENEKEMINNIFELSNISVGNIYASNRYCCGPSGCHTGRNQKCHGRGKIFPNRRL